MLVLGRKKNERIRLTINDLEIWITVCDIHENKIRLGIEAPKDVKIQREEIINGE